MITHYKNFNLVKILIEFSKLKKLSPEETLFEILKTNNIKVASFKMNLDDISNFMNLVTA